jgi:adenosylhomocysteine nucleosidase
VQQLPDLAPAEFMRFLVTFAIDAEFSPWRARHPFVPYDFDNASRKRDFDMFRANIGVNEVTVLLTGMGGASARRAMQIVPPELHDVWISTGLAGALDAELKLSTIVVANQATTSDCSTQVASDPRLVRAAVACAATRVETFLTSETIVATAIAKEELRVVGNVVEMETAFILAAARERQMPAVAVRAISDTAEEDLPLDFGKIADAKGHLKVGGLFLELVRQPYRLPLLIKFGRQSRAAATSLADFLDRYLAAVATVGRAGQFADDLTQAAREAHPRKEGWLH